MPKPTTKKARSAQTLPAGWRTVRFGDVVRNVNAIERNPLQNGIERFLGLEHLDPESLHIKRWGLVADGTTFTRKFTRGQVLFGKRRAYQRKVAVAEFNGICSGDILVFEPTDDELIPELLPFIVQSDGFFEKALGTSAGSLSPRTKWRDLAAYEFALPPKDEQRRIAAILRAADEAVRKSEECVERLTEFPSAMFNHWLENGRADHSWTVAQLGDLMEGSPRSGHSVVSAGRETGHHVLILSALTPIGYEPGHLKPVDPTPEVQGARLEKGDFLISRSNTIELVGLVGIFNEDRTDVSFPDTMMLIPVNQTRVDKEFLEQFLLSGDGRRQIHRIAAGTSGSMKKINRQGLSTIRVPLPPLDSQKQLMGQLDKCRVAVEAAKNRLHDGQELLDALRATLLAPTGDNHVH